MRQGETKKQSTFMHSDAQQSGACEFTNEGTPPPDSGINYKGRRVLKENK